MTTCNAHPTTVLKINCVLYSSAMLVLVIVKWLSARSWGVRNRCFLSWKSENLPTFAASFPEDVMEDNVITFFYHLAEMWESIVAHKEEQDLHKFQQKCCVWNILWTIRSPVSKYTLSTQVLLLWDFQNASTIHLGMEVAYLHQMLRMRASSGGYSVDRNICFRH